MSRLQFVQYLLSRENTALCARRCSVEAMGGLDEPLTAYWCAASHNSFMVGNQITSRCSAELIGRLLLQGVRSIELDVWDSRLGPVVTHKHTLSNSVPFAHVARVIAKTAFVTSSLPLIVSLQMGCSLPQQRQIAGLIRKELGGMVSTADATASPEQLRNCILFKTKLTKVGKPRRVGPRPSDGGGSSCARSTDPCRGAKSGPGTPASATTDSSSTMPSQVRQATSSVGRHSLNRQTTSVKVQLATELHALIALHGRTKGEFFDTDNQSGWERGITSLGEKRVGDDPEDHPVEDMVLQPLTAARLCRSFPDAMRFMSDNGDPLPAWRKGVQHVALNLQCNDLPTQLHAALFRLGGGHGYVLKPSALRGPQPKWPVGSTSVHCTTLRVLSLHHLPTRDECRPLLTAESHHSYEPALSGAAIPPSGSRANVSSPAVRIELHAIGGHCCVSSTLPPTRHASRHHTTRPADGNGFNPAFDEREYCLAAEPRTTVLRLLVEDAGSVAAYETLILGAIGQDIAQSRCARGSALRSTSAASSCTSHTALRIICRRRCRSFKTW